MKPASKIPWSNHCMNKYGKGIFKELFQIGEKQVSDMLLYKALGNIKYGAEQKKKIWFSSSVGTC